MIIIGIDPGQTGAVAFYQPNKMPVLEMHVMPATARELANLFDEIKTTDRYAFVERAQCMPKQGISSAFNYGRHFGEILGVLATLIIPYHLVPASTWTKSMHASTKRGDAKARSKEAALRMFPSANFLATERSKVPHAGLIDAALIAAYGAKTLRAGL